MDGVDHEVLPSGWEAVTLSDVCVVNPPANKTTVSDDELVSFVPMAAVEELTGNIDLSDERPFSQVKKGYTRFQDGDVLFAKITPSMENGKVATVRGLKNGVGCGSTEFHVVRPAGGVHPDYVRLFLVRGAYRQVAQRNMKGTAGQLRVPPEFIRNSRLPLPPTAEQRRIISKIDELFSQIDAGEANLKRVQVLVKQYRQSILKAAVTGELTRDWREKNQGKGETGEVLLKRTLAARRQAWEDAELAKLRAKGKAPKDDKWKAKYKEPAAPDTSGLPDLPEGWSWATVGQIADVSGGVTKNAKRKDCPIKRPYLRVANVYERQLKLDEVHEIGLQRSELERVTLEKNDLLIVEGNGSIDQIGRVALWDGSIPNCVHQNHLIKARFKENALAQFALVWCASPLGRSFIERAASSTSGLHTLSISKIDALPIPLPNELEIKIITDRWAEMESAVLAGSSDAQNQFSRLSTLRQAVLRAAFCGTLVPQDPDDEPAPEIIKRILEAR